MAIWNKLTQAYLTGNKTLFEAFMLADKDGNIINTFGSASNIPIAAGLVDGYSHINKFGHTGDDINGTTTIWDGSNGVYTWPTAAGVVSVASASQSGETVVVEGLDVNYNVVSEETTIGGTTTAEFYRIYRAYMTGDTNESDVTFQIGGTTYAIILADNGQTLMTTYTVPAGKTAYLMQLTCTMDKTNAPTFFRLMSRPVDNGTAFNIKSQLGSQGGNPVNFEYAVPLVFPEKTDIKVDVITQGSVGCGATYDLILVENPT
jgi:hypothetical protein